MNEEVKDEVKKEEKVEEAPKQKDFLGRVVPAHNVVSRDVTEADIDRVISEAHILFNICHTPINGRYGGALAMHHSQIDYSDPLSFYVTAEGQLIINPKVLKHSKTTVDSEEGCVTFPDKDPIIVQRWNKMEIEYQTVIKGENGKYTLTPVMKDKLGGIHAKRAQHEIDHGNAIYIYKEDN